MVTVSSVRNVLLAFLVAAVAVVAPTASSDVAANAGGTVVPEQLSQSTPPQPPQPPPPLPPTPLRSVPKFQTTPLATYEARLIDRDLQIALGGGGHGLTAETATISGENLQRILVGVENGKKESYYFFGLLKLYGISLPKDVEVAAQYFRKASDHGHAEGATAAGVMHLTGVGVQKDYAMAIALFRRGVGLGDTNALWLLGKTLIEIAASPDIDQVMRAWSAGATPDMPVGRTPHEEAARLLTLAAEDNIPQAFHYLGVLHEYGLGVRKDSVRARTLYGRAAEERYIESMYHLALMQAFGRGGSVDYRAALALLEAGGRADHAPSCYYMGVFKTYGYGCEPDYAEAINWFEKAAALDDYRVSVKAFAAAAELKTLVAEADAYNNELLELMKSRSESR